MSRPDTIITWHTKVPISPVTLYTDTDGYTTGLFFTEYAATAGPPSGLSQYPTLTIDHLGNSTTSSRTTFDQTTCTTGITSTLTKTSSMTLTTAYMRRGGFSSSSTYTTTVGTANVTATSTYHTTGFQGSVTYTVPVTTYSTPSTATVEWTTVTDFTGPWDGSPFTLKTFVSLLGGSTMAMAIVDTSVTGTVRPATDSNWTFTAVSKSFSGATSLTDKTRIQTYATLPGDDTLTEQYAYTLEAGTVVSTTTFGVGSVTETVSTSFSDGPNRTTTTLGSPSTVSTTGSPTSVTTHALTTTNKTFVTYPTRTIPSTTTATTTTRTGTPSTTTNATNVPSTTGTYQSTSTTTLASTLSSLGSYEAVIPKVSSYGTVTGWITVSSTTGSSGVTSVSTITQTGIPGTTEEGYGAYSSLVIPGLTLQSIPQASMEMVVSRKSTGWMIPGDTKVYGTVNSIPSVSYSTEFRGYDGVVTPALHSRTGFTQIGASYTIVTDATNSTNSTSSGVMAGASSHTSTYARTEMPVFYGSAELIDHPHFSVPTSRGFTPIGGTMVISPGIYISRSSTTGPTSTTSRLEYTTTGDGTMAPAISYSKAESAKLPIEMAFGTYVQTDLTYPFDPITDTITYETFSTGGSGPNLPIFTVRRFWNRWATQPPHYP